jgi:hypothetical protein
VKQGRIAKSVLVGVAVLGLLAQLIPVARTNPEVVSDIEAPAQVKSILRRACYDCHSNETRWPWYSAVAPLSWRLTSHVNAGRADLNFSEWPALDFELQDLEFEEIHDQIQKSRMPPADYVLMHPRARLTLNDRHVLLEWAGGSP